VISFNAIFFCKIMGSEKTIVVSFAACKYAKKDAGFAIPAKSNLSVFLTDSHS
jgi:hypothetical protein